MTILLAYYNTLCVHASTCHAERIYKGKPFNYMLMVACSGMASVLA